MERHPEPRNENVRGAGRQERRRRHEEEERGKKRRYPPIPEVAFELLGEAESPLAPSEVLRLARERQLASDELRPEALLTSLAEENQRRIDAGRRPNFALDPTGALMLERDDLPVADVQSAFARALDLPFTDGRIVPAASRPRPPRPSRWSTTTAGPRREERGQGGAAGNGPCPPLASGLARVRGPARRPA